MNTDRHRWLLSAFICVHLWLTPAFARVKSGLDVLVEQKFAPLAGKRVGVITNHSAITLNHEHLIDLLAKAPNVKLVAIFTAEHGLSGTAAAGAEISSGTYEKTGTPIYSLYQRGGSQRLNEEM